MENGEKRGGGCAHGAWKRGVNTQVDLARERPVNQRFQMQKHIFPGLRGGEDATMAHRSCLSSPTSRQDAVEISEIHGAAAGVHRRYWRRSAAQIS